MKKHLKIILATLFFAIAFTNKIQAQLNAFVPNLSGRYEITAAARGSSSSTYTITLQKPVGATTAYKVFLYNAGIAYWLGDFPEYNYMLSSTIGVDGTSYTFPASARRTAVDTYNFQYYGYSGEVSGALKTKLDAATAGNTINLTISEGNASQNRGTDGVGIVVIWNNPTKPVGSHAVHMGMDILRASPNGAVVNIPVSPINKSLIGFEPILGVGINFSTGTVLAADNIQQTRITVNGSTITQMAGGYDDGTLVEGQIITLGGYGDSPTTNDQDELYNITNFINNGAENLQFVLTDVDSRRDDVLNVVYFSGVGVTPLPCNLQPSVVTTSISNTCPATTVNLNTQGHIGAIPGNANTQLQWYTSATRNAGTQVTNPTAVGAGVYYAFYYSSDAPACYSPASSAVTVSIIACPPIISSITPATQSVCINAAPAAITVTATGAVSYQWYKNASNSNIGGTLISGATSASYTPPASATVDTSYYYVRVTNASGSVNSSAVQVSTITCCNAGSVAPIIQ